MLQVSEAAMLENLEYLESNKPAFPIQLVQLDDGYPVCAVGKTLNLTLP